MDVEALAKAMFERFDVRPPSPKFGQWEHQHSTVHDIWRPIAADALELIEADRIQNTPHTETE